MQAWHLTYASRSRASLFPDESLRHRAIHAIARAGGNELVAFCLVDDHIHLVVLASQARVGHLSRTVLLSLAPIAGAPLDPAHRRMVDGRSHLEWLMRYCLMQPAKHDIGVHPALWSGSFFLDLAGARLVPGIRLRIPDALPRFRLGTAFSYLGLPMVPLEPVTDDQLRAFGATRIASAAASAFSAEPKLMGNDAPTVSARNATANLARIAGFPPSEAAWVLRVTKQAAGRMAKRNVDQKCLEAVRLRLALEEAVALHAKSEIAGVSVVKEFPQFPYGADSEIHHAQ